MIEKVNPSHPDKVADRIAGALVDLAYTKSDRPKIAVEVLIGHSNCHIICETSEHFTDDEVRNIVWRITAGPLINIDYKEVPQDTHLAANQDKRPRCGDNGIFKGMPLTAEQILIRDVARWLYGIYPTDGKFILDMDSPTFIACQSNCDSKELERKLKDIVAGDSFSPCFVVNPLGDWTGGTDVDTGATNRKLGSDMADGVTGGGLHGKDLSKADVSMNIVAHKLAQKFNTKVEAFCAIGDEEVEFRIYDDRNGDTFKPMYLDYSAVLNDAKAYIDELGGFEKLAEWGLF